MAAPSASPAAAAAMPGAPLSFEAPFRAFCDAAEREYVRASSWCATPAIMPPAARAAGIERTYIYRLMRKHGL